MKGKYGLSVHIYITFISTPKSIKNQPGYALTGYTQEILEMNT